MTDMNAMTDFMVPKAVLRSDRGDKNGRMDMARCAIHFALHLLDVVDDLTNVKGFLQQMHYHNPTVVTHKMIELFPHKNTQNVTAATVPAATVPAATDSTGAGAGTASITSKNKNSNINNKNVTLVTLGTALLMERMETKLEYDVYKVILLIANTRRNIAIKALAEEQAQGGAEAANKKNKVTTTCTIEHIDIDESLQWLLTEVPEVCKRVVRTVRS